MRETGPDRSIHQARRSERSTEQRATRGHWQGTAEDPPADTDVKSMADQGRVQAQLYDQLYQHLPVGIIATVVNAIIVAFILWKLVSHTVLLVWLGANLVAAGVRSVFLFAYRQSSW